MTYTPIRLGVNIDHVATIRQARLTRYPDPLQAALLAQQAGADGITLHLREDRRHIQDRDVRLLKELLQVPMNLEMAASPEMIEFACELKPEHCCLVPEKREELTTEGGLDVVSQEHEIAHACKQLSKAGIEVSLFIDPDKNQIDAAMHCQAPVIELHTGCYADAKTKTDQDHELQRIVEAAKYADKKSLIVNAGHGLHYHNVQAIAAIPEINELNIGHGIIAHALFVGLERAIKEMKALMVEARVSSSHHSGNQEERRVPRRAELKL